MRTGWLFTLTGLVLAAALGATSASAQSLPARERLVLAAFNMCWEVEDGTDYNRVMRENNFFRLPDADNLAYFRTVENTTVTMIFRFDTDQLGRPKGGCRIMAHKPQLDTPFTPRGPILPAFEQLLDRIMSSSARMGLGYRPAYVRRQMAGQPRRSMTLLRQDIGAFSKVIQIDEAPTYFEFFYFHAHRDLIDREQILTVIADAETRDNVQWLVNDQWAVMFCRLNPNQCRPASPPSSSQQAAASSGSPYDRPLPFSGIGAAAGNGDNRTHQQRLESQAYWDDYHRRCARIRC